MCLKFGDIVGGREKVCYTTGIETFGDKSMKDSVEQRNRIVRVVLAIGSALLAIAFVCLFAFLLGRDSELAEEQDFDTGWEISINGQRQHYTGTLPEYRFSDLQVGDVVVLTNTLPSDFQNEQTLTVLVYLSTIEAQVDGQEVYRYGQEYAEKNELVGSGYHFINLPTDAADKQITITLEVREPGAFTNITTPVLSATKDVYRDLAHRHLSSAFIGVFLVLLGALMTLVSAVALCYSKVYLRLLYTGIFSFLMGIWSMCNMKTLEIFKVNLAANTLTEYLSLYLAPIAFILLVAETRKNMAAWRQQIVYAAAILLSMFAVMATVLQFMNIDHYPRVLGYFHLFAAVSLFLVLITGIDKGHKLDRSAKAMHAGIIILCISVGADLVRFNLQKYVMPDNEWLSVSVMPYGALFFILMLVVSYILYVYNIFVDEAEQEWLAERAYHDELCGTYNRTKCNEVFNELDEGNEEYALVNLDVNGLKLVNDTLGHAQGDLLLQEFAVILQTVFKNIGEVFRMGGDEFLVVVRQDQFPQIDQCLNRMVRMEKRRSGELSFVIDSAYGVAKSTECPNEKVQKVYMLADERMYEMKTKQKINRRLR